MNTQVKNNAPFKAHAEQPGLEIDLEALMENISQIKQLDPEMIKCVAEEVTFCVGKC